METQGKTYTPSRQRALKKYYLANREELLVKMRERHQTNYDKKKSSEEWKAKKREYNRRFREKLKQAAVVVVN